MMRVKPPNERHHSNPKTVRPELVEGLPFFFFSPSLSPHGKKKEGQGFDKLSPNGEGVSALSPRP